MKLSFGEIKEATKGKVLNKGSKEFITGICIDSRYIRKGDLFIAIVGDFFDGHDFIGEVLEKGAAGVVVSKNIKDAKNEATMIKVKNTLDALHDLARYYRNQFDIPMIAITGSTGKTTTKELVYSVLATKYNVLKNKGNYNNHIGLPLTVFQLEPHHEVAIFEMGMSGLGEIDLLTSIIKPEIGIVTNIGLSHIEKLGSQNNILEAKLEIVNGFQSKGILVINADDDYLAKIDEQRLGHPLFKVGKSEDNDLSIGIIEIVDENKIDFEVIFEEKTECYSINLLGVHNVYNAMMAISIAHLMGVSEMDIRKGLLEYFGDDMRLNIVKNSQGIKIVNDVYNASPDSMKAAINVLTNLHGGRRIAILGDMLEMGDYSKSAHQEIGEYLAEKGVDVLLAIGEQASYIQVSFVAKTKKDFQAYVFKNNNEVIQFLKKYTFLSDDVVLCKGSRGMKLEKIANYILKR